MSSADDEIEVCLEAKQSFILDAGAGAGKTYSLRKALTWLIGAKSGDLIRTGQSIACITFTKVATAEILAGIGETALVRVSTIHSFLWDMIKPHQKALRLALLKFNAGLKVGSSRKQDQDVLEAAIPDIDITYSETGTNFLEGRLHHDDLPGVAEMVFTDNPLLARIVAAKHPYIFVDEYQDTSEKVVNILLGSILPENPGGVVIGLFGDKLQNIYHGGENPGGGEIPAQYAANLKPVIKGENRRCSVAVISVLNHIRSDITQFPAADNVVGDAMYFHTSETDADKALALVRQYVQEERGWQPAPGEERELFLTHRVMSRKGGYDGLLSAYAARGGHYRDDLLSGDDRRIAFFIEKLEPLAEAWASGVSGKALSTLRSNGFRFGSNADKKAAREALDRLIELRAGGSVREVLEHIRKTKLIALIDDFSEWLAGPPPAPPQDDVDAVARAVRAKIFYDALFGLSYTQVSSFISFFNKHTPFATTHGVKGAEFDTVFVVLDDAGANWNIYSFTKYLNGEDSKSNPGRLIKTRNVFYVCCSRAKRNLAVVDLGKRSPTKDATVAKMFNTKNCVYL